MTQGEAPPDPAEAWVELLGVSQTPDDCAGKTVARVDEFSTDRDTYESSCEVPAYLLTADERRKLADARTALDAYNREKEAAQRVARETRAEAIEREVYARLRAKFEAKPTVAKD